MVRRLRLLAILMVVALVAAACGGDGGTDDPSNDAETTTGQGEGSNSTGEGGDGDTTSTNPGSGDNGGAPEIDPGAMPPAGQVVFEVDGQTFTINSADMDYFLCEPDDQFTNVQSESETQDLSVQFDAQSGRGGANVKVEGSNLEYASFFGPETAGGLAVDAPYIVYEGRFDANNPDDFSFTDVGIGRVSVTCP